MKFTYYFFGFVLALLVILTYHTRTYDDLHPIERKRVDYLVGKINSLQVGDLVAMREGVYQVEDSACYNGCHKVALVNVETKSKMKFSCDEMHVFILHRYCFVEVIRSGTIEYLKVKKAYNIPDR